MSEQKMRNLRVRKAAEALGISLSTFWLWAKTKPDFPQLIKLGPKTTVVREADLFAFLEKRSTAVDPAFGSRSVIRESSVARARINRAAPDLLEACIAVLGASTEEAAFDAIKKVKAAIIKAAEGSR